MDYKILITPIAGQDLSDHMDLISIESCEHANKWLEDAWAKKAFRTEMP